MVEKIINTERGIYARPPISWGAVFAGWLFAYAFAMLLYLLGAAVGVTSLAAINDLSKGVAIGTGVWMVAAWVIATFVGSVIAGRLAGNPERSAGAMHGLVVWALSGIMTLLIGTAQAASAASVGVAAVKDVAKAGTELTQEAGSRGVRVQVPQEIRQTFAGQLKQRATEAIDNMPGTAGAEINRQEARQAIEGLNQTTVIQITASLLEGNQQEARRIFSQQTDLSEEEINSIVNGLSRNIQTTQQEARDTAGYVAEQAADYTSAGLWFLFLSSLLGLGAGALGGRVGAGMAEKYYYAETTVYPTDVSYRTQEKQKVVV